MKRNRLVARILVAIFLASLPGMAGAAGPTITPMEGAKYTMTGPNEMTIESGKVCYSLEKGQTYTFKFQGKVYKATATGDSPVTEGCVTVEGDQLVFNTTVGLLTVVSPAVAGAAGAVAGVSTTTWLVAAGAAVALGAGLGVGLSGNKSPSSP
ncbi:MAG: hypothetical protein ABSG91_10520 [Syntrophobacteraceae bacterium]